MGSAGGTCGCSENAWLHAFDGEVHEAGAVEAAQARIEIRMSLVLR